MSYFQSPLHSHILYLRNFSKHFQTYLEQHRPTNKTIFQCDFCRDDIDGSNPIYCCEKCQFYVHKSCAAPRQIQHPRHQHPLDLQVFEGSKHFKYRCVKFHRGCRFELGADTAMKTLWVEKYYWSMLQEAGDGQSRLQLAHEHPLTSFPATRRIFCGGCKMEISEEAYGCSECKLFLHESCAKAPIVVEHHPFHPEHPLYLFCDPSNCQICQARRELSSLGYFCEECPFIFDLCCVISTMPCEDDDEREEIKRRSSVTDHPLHPHQLSSYHSKTQTKLNCHVCKYQIPSGDFFGCSRCSFFLDESCAQPPIDAIQRFLHPGHTLTFARFCEKEKYYCLICESRVRSDSNCCTCQECDFYIHSACASASLSDLEKGVGMTVRCSFHKHELTCYYNTYHSAYCTACEGTIGMKTLAYRCLSRGCEFKLHESCSQLPSNLEHPSHSLHPLSLCCKPPYEDAECRRCNGGIDDTCAYSCAECNYYLHVECAKVSTLKHPLHEHHLFHLWKTWGTHPECSACRKSCDLDLYCCAQCQLYLHYECSQLPSSVKSEHHWEPLVLHESFKEDESGEYYCDICERGRDPNKWVYFCEIDNHDYYVAHIECALSSVKLEVIEEDDFIRRGKDIQKREKKIKVTQEQVDAKEMSLRPLTAELESMIARLESQRAELEELKTEHAKWIDMESI